MYLKMLSCRVIILAALLTLCGCESLQQNQKAIMGGLLGAGAAGGACMLARGNPLLCGALAVAAGAAGGAIGHTLDARDHATRDAAIALALARAPLPAAAAPFPARVADAGRAANGHPHAMRRQPTPNAAAGGVPGGATPWVNPDEVVQWVNPDTRNSGTIATRSSFADPATGRACHDLNESYVRDGKRVAQTERACQETNGSWSLKDVTG